MFQTMYYKVTYTDPKYNREVTERFPKSLGDTYYELILRLMNEGIEDIREFTNYGNNPGF